MPVILTLGGARVSIYTGDHRPAHVHVRSGGREVVFNLNCPTGPVELREQYGFSHPAVNKLAKQVQKHLGALCLKWSEIHGNF